MIPYIRRNGWQPYSLEALPCSSMILSTSVTSLLSLSALCQSCYTAFHHLALFLPYEHHIACVSAVNHMCLTVFSRFSQKRFLLNWFSESVDTGHCLLRDAAQSWIMRRPNLSLNVCCRRDLRNPLTTHTTAFQL